MSEALNRAKRKYKADKVRTLTIDLYPTDGDIVAHLAKVGPYATYIKNLIREDMKKDRG